jgi:hypothetical protein
MTHVTSIAVTVLNLLTLLANYHYHTPNYLYKGSNMLPHLKAELDNLGAFSDKLPTILDKLLGTIPNKTVPDRMKTVIAISELTTFASQFRRNMWHWDGFELPINSTSFIVAGSGKGKDSSVKAVRRAFAPAYEMINAKRTELAKNAAIQMAEDSGSSNPTEYDEYKEFYFPPAPIYIAPTTPQGFIQHINDLADFPLGAGTMYAGEVGDELATNGHMGELIKTIAETYDTGDKEVVYTKGKEHRSSEISAMPINSLFVGSPNYLIYDEAVKKKFLIAFGSKLARRAFFCYAPIMNPREDFSHMPNPVKATIEAEKQSMKDANIIKEQIATGICQLTEYHLARKQELLTIDEDVFDLFTTYLLHNELVAETIDPKYPLSKLVREHLQWKALKLAGALAIFKMQDKVTVQDYIEAIRVCESLDSDMADFEAELVKEVYETFADYMQSQSVNCKSEIGLHDLKKRKYIPTSGDPTKKMKELVHLAAAYDTNGIYTVNESSISYEAIIKTDVIGISYKPVNNQPIFDAIAAGRDSAPAKQAVAASSAYGLEIDDTSFDKLPLLLSGDYAYSPFKFKDGVRKKENLIGGTKWLVLDIDDSTVTASEVHFMLADLNHHIALSSNAENEYKFRVLLELDSLVDVSPQIWKHFYLAIADELALDVDPLPQSQIFFSYAGREILSTLDAQPLAVRDYLMTATEKATAKPAIEKKLTSPQIQALIDDELETFNQAFFAPMGAGSRKLIWAANKAYKDLGMSKPDVHALLDRINKYWTSPMDAQRFEQTITTFVDRL